MLGLDRIGQTVDFVPTAQRDEAAARRLFKRAIDQHDVSEKIPVPAGACDTWHVYKQDMALAATLTRKDGQDSVVRAISKVEHERLLPVELFEETRSKLVSALAN